jgi:hypothetical protein
VYWATGDAQSVLQRLLGCSNGVSHVQRLDLSKCLLVLAMRHPNWLLNQGYLSGNLYSHLSVYLPTRDLPSIYEPGQMDKDMLCPSYRSQII